MSYSSKDQNSSPTFEFLAGRLYYTAVTATPAPNPQRHYFTIDTERGFQYWNFFLDYGPLNLGQLYRFCALMNQKLSQPKLRDKIIVFYSSSHPNRRANAAFLISAWSMLCLNRSPEDAFRPFRPTALSFPPWHDATQGLCTFNLTIMDTLRGLQKARECNFFSFDRFPIEEYEYYEKVENGDLNWIVEGKFAAFAGPHAASTVESTTGYQHLTPEHYVPYFQHRNVSLVIRLNKKYYDSRSFSNYGIDHMELYFLDGSNPPDHILDTFLRRCEETSGAVAVHCKAGLGRTGSCIGCYMMKHHRFTAEEAIGWMRIARPGCVIGPQQQWLKSMEQRMWHEGEIFRARQVPLTALSLSLKYPEATETDEESSVRGKGTPAVIHSARSSGKIRHTSSDDAVLSLSSKMAILGIGRDTDLLADGITINSARTSRKERTGSTPRTARGTAGNEKPPLSARARSDTTLSGLHRENSVRSTSGTPRTARGSNTATGSTNTGGTTSRTPRTARSRAQSLATQSLNTSLISDAEEGEAATQGDFLVARRMHHQQNAQASIPEFEAKAKRSEDNGNNSLSLNLSAVSNSSLSAPNRSQLPKKSGTPRSAANPPSVIPSAGFSMATRSSKSGNSTPVASGTPISAAAGTAGAGQSPVYSPEEYEGANANSSTSKSKSRFRKFLSSTFKM